MVNNLNTLSFNNQPIVSKKFIDNDHLMLLKTKTKEANGKTVMTVSLSVELKKNNNVLSISELNCELNDCFYQLENNWLSIFKTINFCDNEKIESEIYSLESCLLSVMNLIESDCYGRF